MCGHCVELSGGVVLESEKEEYLRAVADLDARLAGVYAQKEARND